MPNNFTNVLHWFGPWYNKSNGLFCMTRRQIKCNTKNMFKKRTENSFQFDVRLMKGNRTYEICAFVCMYMYVHLLPCFDQTISVVINLFFRNFDEFIRVSTRGWGLFSLFLSKWMSLTIFLHNYVHA